MLSYFTRLTASGGQRVALAVALAFALFGAFWVLASDLLLYRISRDPLLIARFETAKGWLFVGLSAAFVYVVTLRSFFRLARARAKLSAVVESVGDGLLVLGRDRTILHANPAAVQMLRCDSARALIGMGAAEFSRRFRVSYPSGALVMPDQFVSQRVFDEPGPLEYNAVLHPPGGSEIVASVTAAAVRTAGEPVEMVVSVIHDRTAAEQLASLRDEFFAAAAHSLKTPVAVIKANAQLLLRHDAPGDRPSLAAIERQCGRIDRLLQNLIVFARQRSQSLKLHPEELELAPLAQQVAREMSTVSAQHRLRTQFLASPRAYADRELLGMALRNLIEEAIRSSASGSGVTLLLSQAATQAELGVRYQPLPPEQLLPEACRDYDDFGVRRSVSSAIAEAHAGSLREEVSGADTIAWLSLPAIGGVS